MSRSFVIRGVVAASVVMLTVTGAWAGDAPRFFKWLDSNNPQDRAVQRLWEQAEAGRASTSQLIDLGTLLFDKGHYSDAIDMFERALDLDHDLAEAYFRIGLVEHRRDRLQQARRAYRKCLKLFTGHGWCNFYMGMVSEELGDVDGALFYYQRAYRFAPELADPAVNPQVLYSDLQIAVRTRSYHGRFLERNMPMELVEPEGFVSEGSKQPSEPLVPPSASPTGGLVAVPETVTPPEAVGSSDKPVADVGAPDKNAPQPKATSPASQDPSGRSQEVPTPTPEAAPRVQRAPRAVGKGLRPVPSVRPTPTPEADPPKAP